MIQTDRFGDLLSQRIATFAKKKFSADMSFERLEFSLIPFSTTFINIDLKTKELEVSASELSLRFGFRDLFSNEFSVGKLSLTNAFVSVESSSKSKKEYNWKDAFKIYKRDIYGALPFRLRGISLVNTEIELSDGSVEVLNLSSSLYPNLLTTKFDISISKELEKLIKKESDSEVSIDGLSGELQLSKDYIRLKEARVASENSFIGANGKILFDETISNIRFSGFVDLDKVKPLIKSPKVNKKILPSGSLEFKGVVNGTLSNYSVDGSVFGVSLRSPFYKIRSVKGSVSLENGIISAEDLSARIGKGSLKTTTKAMLFSFPDFRFLEPEVNLVAENLFSNDILFFLPALENTKFFLNGEARVDFVKDGAVLFPFNDLVVKNFKVTNDDSKIILENPKLNIPEGGRLAIKYKGTVYPDLKLNFPNSSIRVKGSVNGDSVNVSLDKSIVDFQEFGPIAGLQLKGRGSASGKIRGPLKNVKMNFVLNQKDFEVLGFKLDKVRGGLNYNLRKSHLSLIDVRGSHRKLDYKAAGSIDFKSRTKALDMNIQILKGNLVDSKFVMGPVLKPLEKFLEGVDFNYTSSLKMTGGLSVPLMKVIGEIKAKSIVARSEDIEEVSSNFQLEKERIFFSNIRGKKVSGLITGDADVHLGTRDFNYKGRFSGLRLKDFYYYRFLGLGFDGDAFGEFYGVGNPKSFSTRSHLRVSNSSIENVRLEDSVLTVYNNKEDLFFSGSLIGGEASLEGYLNLGKTKKKKSSFSARIKTQDLKVLSGFIGKHNITNNRIKGKLNLSMQTDFHFEDLTSLNLKGVISDFALEYPGIDIEPIKKPIIVEIEQGVIKAWNYSILGKGFNLKANGSGNLHERFTLAHDFQVDSSLFELITDHVKKSSGLVSGSYLVLGKKEKFSNFLSLKANSLAFKIKQLPGLFSDFSFNLNLDNKLVRINQAGGVYGNGRVHADGSIRLRFPFPEVKLDVNVERSRFPLFKKSGVVVSGDLELRGKKLPYDLKGNLVIIQGEVVEEMSDLASSAINNDSYQRFIPVGFLEGNISFINTDIGITSFSPIKIKNGLIDVGLGGNLKIFGSVSSPRVNGELDIQNQENKFVFKGHEFFLNEGIIRFIDQARKESPELRFGGVARINEYDVYISLNGPADNLTVEMSSNPPLVQEDILSLLTLGVTNDVSRNLGDRQRQSVTTLSIGSLIMDQLKINQSLNDSLGLRLSVQPDFVEDENSLLEGRVEDSGTGNRFRSSTVVKVQKKISKKVNLSVSSTLGGSVDQSQQMNVNYKINKSWSLEGVYEVRSNDELEQELPDSVGADVKFQWSF